MADEPLTPTTTSDAAQSPASGSDHWPPLIGDSERADPNERTPPQVAVTPRGKVTPSEPPESEEPDEAALPLTPEGVAVQAHQRGQPGKPLSKTQLRINQAVSAQRNAERARDDALERLRELEEQSRPRPVPPSNGHVAPVPQAASRDPNRPEPKEDEFQTYAEFVRATARWENDRAMAAFFQAQAAVQQQTAQQTAEAAFTERRTAYLAEHPDFAEVVGASDLPVSEAMDQFFTHDPAGVAVIDYLARHPDEGDALAQLPPGPAYVALGRLAQRVDAQHSTNGVASHGVSSPPRAPHPITPVGAGAHRSSDPSDLEFGPEYVRRGNEADRTRRRGGLR